jgi:outer membrane immunogenic protein
MDRTAQAVALATLALMPTAVLAADASLLGGSIRSDANFWQGPYVGANLGHQWSWVSKSTAKPSGIAGGVQAGYNWQTRQFVLGAEADFQRSGADDRFAAWQFSNPWFGTLRGRAGITMGPVLLYGTLGLAYGTLRAQSVPTGVTETKPALGWVGGAGAEIALMSNWSARVEYLYVDLGDRPYSVTGMNHGIDSSLLRMGVNYRF